MVIDTGKRIHHVATRTQVFGISLVKAGGALAWGAINVLEITYASEVFSLDLGSLGEMLGLKANTAAALGAIFFMTGVGTGLGPIFMRRILGDRPRRLMFGISVGFIVLALGIFGLSRAPTFSIYLLATLTRTIGSGTIWVFSAALLQMIVPDAFRGRVFAFEFAMFTLTQSVSIFAAGALMDAGVDVRQVTGVMAITAVIVTMVWILFYIPNISRVDGVVSAEVQTGTVD